MSNAKVDLATRVLKQYAEEKGVLIRSTSDLSPLEEWLILRIYRCEYEQHKPEDI